MYSHGIRELGFEQVVVAPRDFGHGLGEVLAFGGGEVGEGADVTRVWEDQGLVGPGCPVGAEDGEGRVGEDQAVGWAGEFETCVVEQHVAAALFAVVFLEVLQLEGRFFGEAGRRPDLAVRVWV